MGKLAYLNISFPNIPEPIFKAGDFIQGQIEFSYNEVEKLRGIRLEIYGVTYTHWSETEGSSKNRHTVHYGCTQIHINTKLILWGSPSSASRNQVQQTALGPAVLPFSFQLPPYLPESYEGGSYGHTRYTVKAVMDRPWKFDHTFSRILTILGHVDLNMAATLGLSDYPLMNAQRKQESMRVNCCCCCPLLCNGRIHYDLSIPKSGFVPGESIRVWGFVKNDTKGKLENLRLKLIQHVVFYGRRNCHTYDFDSMFHVNGCHRRYNTNTAVELPLKVTPSVVLPGQTVYIGGAANDTTCIMQIPPLPSTRRGASPIHITYKLVLCMDGDNCCLSAEPEISEIVLGTVPLTTAPLYPPFLPPPNSPPPSYDLPPPTYAQSVFGPQAVDFTMEGSAPPQEDSNQGGQASKAYGQQTNEFAPKYVYYDWSAYQQ